MEQTNQDKIYQSGFEAGYSDLWSRKWAKDKTTSPAKELTPQQLENWQQGYIDGSNKATVDYANYAETVGIASTGLIFGSVYDY